MSAWITCNKHAPTSATPNTKASPNVFHTVHTDNTVSPTFLFCERRFGASQRILGGWHRWKADFLRGSHAPDRKSRKSHLRHRPVSHLRRRPTKELYQPVSRLTSLLSWQVLHFLTANCREKTFVLQAYLPRTEMYSCSVSPAPGVRRCTHLVWFVIVFCLSIDSCERRFGASQRKNGLFFARTRIFLKKM